MAVSIGLTAQQKVTITAVQPDITCLLPDEEALPYAIIEEKPLFNGDEDLLKFREWVYENIRIPQEYGDEAFQATIIVEFIVNRNGDVCNAKIVRPIDRLMDVEVLRVVNESPRWQPATRRGKNVSVTILIPVRIRF